MEYRPDYPRAPSRWLDVWTDGSGTLVDGPACVGVVIFEGWHSANPGGPMGMNVCEASEFVAMGTNNLAELRAIRRGLHLAELIGGLETPVTVFSDSEYAIGSCTKDWRAQSHLALITALRKQVRGFHFLRFVHVDGHAGIYGNELADWLAGEARRRYLASQNIVRRAKRRPLGFGESPPERPAALKAVQTRRARRGATT